ncbi:MAG: AmmeMemoRadiSam system protein B [Proteobacteria bacterium]|nr:AmmeMemoRadiSam system protein B [Pseudomonadota bacterium]
MNRLCAAALALAALTLTSAQASCKKTGDADAAKSVQQPVVAGTFYPADAKSLRSMVKGMIDMAPVKALDGELIGIIAPHAGYRYSGRVAAAAFRQLAGRGFTRAVVIAPSHRAHVAGAALSPFSSYRTPLGDIPIDREAVDALSGKHPWAEEDAGAFSTEHSLEVELPFLQVALGEFKLVPIIVGQAGKKRLDAIAEALEKELGDRSTIFVASSDLSHFHDYEKAQRLDSATVGIICDKSPGEFLAAAEVGKAQLCGSSPVYIMKRIAEMRGASLELLEYANSGDATGDRSRVVGYASIAVTAPRSMGMPQEEALLSLARRTIEAHLSGKPLPPLPGDPALAEDGAAFVTLRKNGRLRGCIGTITARGPLDRTVQEMAISAATGDPRFPPVKRDELKDISIEISVLTPPEPLPDPMAVRVGTDGLIIEQGFARGVLLPQVPAEQGWDKAQYLEGISTKAGLPRDAWKRAKLYRFQAIVFEERSD